MEGYERGEAFSVGDDEIEAVGGAGFNEIVHFVDSILEDRKPWSTLDDAVQTMRLCEAIRAGHQGTSVEDTGYRRHWDERGRRCPW